MKKEELISSGILESYVMGTCSEREKRLVEEACLKNADIFKEIIQIEEILLSYASASAPAFSADIKSSIFSKTVLTKSDIQLKGVVIFNLWTKFAIAAGIAILLISASFNLLFYKNSAKISADRANDKEQYQLLVKELNQHKATIKNVTGELAVIVNSATKMIVLKSVDPKLENNAVVFWNATSKQAFISVASLPVAPLNMQYQLWAIVGGKPVDLGVLNSGALEFDIQKVKEISAASAFAITIEQQGGSPTPTLNRMIVLGSV